MPRPPMRRRLSSKPSSKSDRSVVRRDRNAAAKRAVTDANNAGKAGVIGANAAKAPAAAGAAIVTRADRSAVVRRAMTVAKNAGTIAERRAGKNVEMIAVMPAGKCAAKSDRTLAATPVGRPGRSIVAM